MAGDVRRGVREIGDFWTDCATGVSRSRRPTARPVCVETAQAACAEEPTPEAQAWAEQAADCVRGRDDAKARLEPLLELGALAATAGDAQRATSALSEVRELARACDTPGPYAVATAYRALVTGDATTARQALDENGDRLSHGEKLTMHALQWKVTRDEVHLETAWRLLQDFCAYAPEDCRESMRRNVRLYRELTEAWAAQGEHGKHAER